MFTKGTKKNIDYLGAVGLAAAAGYFTYSKKKGDMQVVFIVIVVALVLGYIFISQITKQIYMKGPNQVPTGNGCNDYDPRALVARIYEDLTCTFCTRDIEAYDKLLALSDCEFTKCHNYWQQDYFSKNSQSMLEAIQSDSGSTFDPFTFSHQQQLIADRYARLQIPS